MSLRLNAPLPIHQVDGRHMKHAFPSLRAWVPYWRLPRRRCRGYFAEVNWPCLIRTYARSSTPDYGPLPRPTLATAGRSPPLSLTTASSMCLPALRRPVRAPSLNCSGAGRRSLRSWRRSAAASLYSPVEPRQVFQAGANYRTHVIDLAVAHHDGGDGRGIEQVRADAAAMDARLSHP